VFLDYAQDTTVVDLSEGRIEFATDETGNTITVVLPRASGPTT